MLPFGVACFLILPMMIIKAIRLIFILVIFCNWSFSQTIEGELRLLKSQEITWEGFEGTNTYPISKCTIDENGSFKLTYAVKDFGMGFLKSAGNKPLFVILIKSTRSSWKQVFTSFSF
jgi:hypothetical protein